MPSLSRHIISTQKTYRSTPPRRTLCLESLEDRTVPSYTFTTIEPPGSIFTEAIGINDSGEIVGDYRLADNLTHGFLLSGGTYTTVDFPGHMTVAFSINNSGQIVGTYQADLDSPPRGFLLSGGVFTTIDVPGSIQTLA